jgi:hypothetical protein
MRMRWRNAGELARLEAVQLRVLEEDEGAKQAGGAVNGAARGARDTYGFFSGAPEHVFVR